jgi:hypothetical protein
MGGQGPTWPPYGDGGGGDDDDDFHVARVFLRCV